MCAKLKEAKITPITGDGAYATSFLGYHLGRYLGQDGVKALVGDPAVKEKVEAGEIEAVSWDDREWHRQRKIWKTLQVRDTSPRT
ncbi:hypothetical protein [Suipraeoptans intestinalis]|uniref:hypothetical protein n=1 Tax=Suipraeoptans intestinalis TaxID=2606628 RepID=UPI002ED46FE5